MGTHTKTLSYALPTPAAILGGIRRVDRFRSLAGPCCLAREDIQEAAPSCVVDGLVEAHLARGPVGQIAALPIRLRCGAAAEIGGLNGLVIDGVVLAHERQGGLVVKVDPLPAHVLVFLGEQFHRLLATVAALLLPRDPLLRFLHLTLRCAIVARVLNDNTFSPTSMPVSRPVSGSGSVGTSAHEKETYQPSAS